MQLRWGEEGGWVVGDNRERLAEAHTPRAGDAVSKGRGALSLGLLEPWNALCEEGIRSHGFLHGKEAG